MSTDLTTVKDHPAVIFDRLAQEAKAAEAEFGAAPHASMAFRAASSVLRGVEMTTDVTFAALDNKTLAAAREAYDALSYADGLTVAEFVSAVGDLLGLD